MKFYKNQKGVSLYLAIVVMVALLSIVLGISVILTRQFKIIRGMENSVIALYAADAGIETALKDILHDITGAEEHYPSGEGRFSLDNGAEWEADVSCCSEGMGNCIWNSAGGNPCPITEDANCNARYYCVKSRGYYKETQRAVQVDL